MEVEKVDAEWNQAEWDDLKERMEKRLRRNLLLNSPIGIQIVFLFGGLLLYGTIIQRPC